MGTPPTEELLKKIEQLEEGHAHLKQEMSRLKLSDARGHHHHHGHHRQRSHSVSPQRSRLGAPPRKGAPDGASATAAAWKRGSCSFKQSSPLQRESRSSDPKKEGEGGKKCGPSAVNFTDRQYLNILQSMGQSVHILDLTSRIIYWSVFLFLLKKFHFVVMG